MKESRPPMGPSEFEKHARFIILASSGLFEVLNGMGIENVLGSVLRVSGSPALVMAYYANILFHEIQKIYEAPWELEYTSIGTCIFEFIHQIFQLQPLLIVDNSLFFLALIKLRAEIVVFMIYGHVESSPFPKIAYQLGFLTSFFATAMTSF